MFHKWLVGYDPYSRFIIPLKGGYCSKKKSIISISKLECPNRSSTFKWGDRGAAHCMSWVTHDTYRWNQHWICISAIDSWWFICMSSSYKEFLPSTPTNYWIPDAALHSLAFVIHFAETHPASCIPHYNASWKSSPFVGEALHLHQSQSILM